MTATTCPCTHLSADHDDWGCVLCPPRKCERSAMSVDALVQAQRAGWAQP